MPQRASIAALAAVALLLPPAMARAQSPGWPERPIRLIVPYPPGGGADTLARAIGLHLTDAWSQQVVVDNRPGGGANIGAELAARAAPDGYTIFIAALAHSVNVSLYRKLAYDIRKDLAPVVFVSTVPGILVVHPSVPVRTTQELIAHAKANPGKVNYASTGSGGPQHLGMELFKHLSGAPMTHIPYKGAAPALADVIGGQVHTILGNMISTLPHTRANRLRGIAVTSAKRSNAVPELPTIAESGVPGFESGSWFGLMVPAGTPKGVVDRLNAETNRFLAMPETVKRFGRSGAEMIGGTPEDLARHLRTEIAKWAKVIEVAKVRVD